LSKPPFWAAFGIVVATVMTAIAILIFALLDLPKAVENIDIAFDKAEEIYRRRFGPPTSSKLEPFKCGTDLARKRSEQQKPLENDVLKDLMSGCGDTQPSQIAIRSSGLSSHLMLVADGIQLGSRPISSMFL